MKTLFCTLIYLFMLSSAGAQPIAFDPAEALATFKRDAGKIKVLHSDGRLYTLSLLLEEALFASNRLVVTEIHSCQSLRGKPTCTFNIKKKYVPNDGFFESSTVFIYEVSLSTGKIEIENALYFSSLE